MSWLWEAIYLGSVILLPLCGVVGGSESNGGATLLLNHEIANNLSSQEQFPFQVGPSIVDQACIVVQDTQCKIQKMQLCLFDRDA